MRVRVRVRVRGRDDEGVVVVVTGVVARGGRVVRRRIRKDRAAGRPLGERMAA